ncbi:hypothetical protein ACET3Z_000004 [Daucus carota]
MRRRIPSPVALVAPDDSTFTIELRASPVRLIIHDNQMDKYNKSTYEKAWKVAQAPSKNLLIMGFMMWVAGSTMHLFSIDITFSVLWQPISVLQGVGKVFEPYKDGRVDLFGPKLLYIALNLPLEHLTSGKSILLVFFQPMHQTGCHLYLLPRNDETIVAV